MRLPPGSLLQPQDLSVGAKVQAYASDGYWWNAKVEEKGGRGVGAWIRVRFNGFGPKHDEQIKVNTGKLRAKVSAAALKLEHMPANWKAKLHLRNKDGTWPIEKLIKKRRRNGRREYLVRWKVCPLPSACLRARPDHLATSSVQPFACELHGDASVGAPRS